MDEAAFLMRVAHQGHGMEAANRTLLLRLVRPDGGVIRMRRIVIWCRARRHGVCARIVLWEGCYRWDDCDTQGDGARGREDAGVGRSVSRSFRSTPYGKVLTCGKSREPVGNHGTK